MPRLIVILLISWAYVGCTPRRAALPDLPPESLRGGAVRVAVDTERLAEALLSGAVGRPLRPVPEAYRPAPSPGVVSPREDVAAPSRCSRFHLVSGGGVLPQVLIAELERRLRDPDSAAGWLLRPVAGAAGFAAGRRDRVDGLSVDGSAVLFCTEAPAPDLPQRLLHSDLLYWERDPSAGLARGPGPFIEADSRALVPNPQAEPAPILSLVDRIVADDAALFLELGEVDAALVYGRAAARLLDSGPPGLSFERAPDWDRRFALWLDPLARWLNDPRFRRWTSRHIDRPAMIEHLFGGRGEALDDLLDQPDAGAIEAPTARPVSAGSVPRFALAFDAADSDAERIAARVKAQLQTERVEVTLLPMPRDQFLLELREGRVQAAVVPVEPFFDDPVLALRETAAVLGPSVEGAILVLDQAAALAAADARLSAALAAEQILLREAVVIPLVRVHAWLATRAGLAGVRVGPGPVLQFHEAGWSR